MLEVASLRGGANKAEDLVQDFVPRRAGRRRDEVLPLDANEAGVDELDDEGAGQADQALARGQAVAAQGADPEDPAQALLAGRGREAVRLCAGLR